MLKPNNNNDVDNSQNRKRVLTQAVINASGIMNLRQAVIAKTLGISESSVSRMITGGYLLKDSGKEWELAALLVRLYRSLDAIMAGDKDSLRAWLLNYNTALCEAPINLISNVAGLAKTVDYVDSYRARV